MVEPITLIVGIATVINLFSTGFNWVKKLISTDELSSSSTISSHLATYSPIIYPSFMMEDTAKSEFDSMDRKPKKKPTEDFESNDRASSSSPASLVGLVLIIVIMIVLVSFIIYQKRIQTQENVFSYEQFDTQCGSVSSSPASQIESTTAMV